ncbi:MAG: type II toxin-antitoxin system RelE/ParE family toxin [Bacteroidales bacterium]|nr:type II toxin-antitoxin system RelE/ParE family toxin [Bacteroidales bacterium]MBQ9435981.1 type II toxin-antitoxin system RelE/ParE family toxin [Bacteroidales bacterium]
MQTFEVRISQKALSDMNALREFLNGLMSEEGAVRYANAMRDEIKLLSVCAQCTSPSTSATLQQIHADARRMISHNRRWIYVYHIENDIVIVDRIVPAKMNKG